MIFQSNTEISKQAEEIAYKHLADRKAEGFSTIDIKELYDGIIYVDYGEIPWRFEKGIRRRTEMGEVLAETRYKSREVVLDESLENDPRFAFTLAHEIKHVIDIFFHPEIDFSKLKPKEVIIIERQADKFASCLLLPSKIIYKAFMDFFEEDRLLYSGPNQYFFNRHLRIVDSFDNFAWQAGNFLQNHFPGVSKECIGNRLKTLGLLQNIYKQESSNAKWFVDQKRENDFNDFAYDFKKRYDNRKLSHL